MKLQSSKPQSKLCKAAESDSRRAVNGQKQGPAIPKSLRPSAPRGRARPSICLPGQDAVRTSPLAQPRPSSAAAVILRRCFYADIKMNALGGTRRVKQQCNLVCFSTESGKCFKKDFGRSMDSFRNTCLTLKSLILMSGMPLVQHFSYPTATFCARSRPLPLPSLASCALA